LAYSAILHNFCIGFHAYYSNWDIWAEEASNSICINSASAYSHSSVERVLAEMIVSYFQGLSCLSMVVHNSC